MNREKTVIHFIPFTHRFKAGEPETIQLSVSAEEVCLSIQSVRASITPARELYIIHDIQVDQTSILPVKVDAFFFSPQAAHYAENRKLKEPYPIHAHQKVSMIVEYTGKAVDPEWLDRSGMLPFGFMLEGTLLDDHSPHDIADERFKRELERLIMPRRSSTADNTVAIGYLLAAALELTLKQGLTVDDMIKSLQLLPSRFPRTN